MSNGYCTICNSNCKSIHACKLFMLSPSLPTHPFYLTCLEFVDCMCLSDFCFMFIFCFFPLLHSCFSAATTQQRSLKFHLVLVNSTHQVRKTSQSKLKNYLKRFDSGSERVDSADILTKLWYIFVCILDGI